MTPRNTQEISHLRQWGAACLLGASLFASSNAQAQEEIDLSAVMNCRALAIAHSGVADLDKAAFGKDATAALREQADFALVLGLWGEQATSVKLAAQALRTGENFLIKQAKLISRLSKETPGPQGYSEQLIDCVPVVWTAVEIAVDKMMESASGPTGE